MLLVSLLAPLYENSCDSKFCGSDPWGTKTIGVHTLCFFPQALDEEYLKVDAQFGGVDQRKIFTFAEKVSVHSSFTPLRCTADVDSTIVWSHWSSVRWMVAVLALQMRKQCPC